jgi:hypothetical protein
MDHVPSHDSGFFLFLLFNSSIFFFLFLKISSFFLRSYFVLLYLRHFSDLQPRRGTAGGPILLFPPKSDEIVGGSPNKLFEKFFICPTSEREKGLSFSFFIHAQAYKMKRPNNEKSGNEAMRIFPYDLKNVKGEKS